MTKPIIRIHNIETNEVIDREMTDAEFAQYEADLEQNAKREQLIEARKNQKDEMLAKLGLTSDEAKLLLG